LEVTFSPLAGENRTPEESIEGNISRMESMAAEFSGATTRPEIEQFLLELRSFKVFVAALMMQLKTMSAGREELLETVEEFEARMDAVNEDLVGINRDFNNGHDSTAMQNLEALT